jgi:hypothetical protein
MYLLEEGSPGHITREEDGGELEEGRPRHITREEDGGELSPLVRTGMNIFLSNFLRMI